MTTLPKWYIAIPKNLSGWPPYPCRRQPWLVGMPAEPTRAICSLIFGGVFEKFPRLRFAFAHGGGTFPATVGRIEKGFDVRPDLTAIDNPVNPRKYLGHFYVDSLIHDERFLKYVIDLIGEDKVCMGTDYPFPDRKSVL